MKYVFSDPKISELVEKARKLIDDNNETWITWASSNKSTHIYNLKSPMAGLVNLFQATGDTEYLDFLFTYFQKHKHVVENETLIKWGHAGIHHGSVRAGAGVGIALSAIYELPEYADETSAMTEFLDRYIFRKWAGNYCTKVSIAGGSDIGGFDMGTDKLTRTGHAILALYLATGRRRYANCLRNLVLNLKAGLSYDYRTRSYYWGHHISGKGGVFNTAHGGDVVDFLAQAYRARAYVNEIYIQRLINTVKKVLWNGNFDSPEFRDCIDGGSDCRNSNKAGYAQQGWAVLAEFDDESEENLLDIYYNFSKTNLQELDSQSFRFEFLGNLAKAIAYSKSLVSASSEWNVIKPVIEMSEAASS